MREKSFHGVIVTPAGIVDSTFLTYSLTVSAIQIAFWSPTR